MIILIHLDFIYCFREYTKNNDSLIVDTFQGQLQSKVKFQYFGSATLDIYCNMLTFNIFKTLCPYRECLTRIPT